MGVIRDFSSYFNSDNDQITQDLDHVEVESIPEEEPRRQRVKHRSRNPARPENTSKNETFKCKSGKKYRRFQNANQLMTMAENEDLSEVSIYDFIPQTVSTFAQFLMEKENMQLWNDFINCTDDDQWSIIECLENGDDENGNEEENASEGPSDKRKVHPAYSADSSFRKIDSDLRMMLKKRRVPMGELSRLEQDISSYFQDNPNSVRRYHLPNSYQRLMVHAICQYLDLASNSFNKDGIRWTKVQNNHGQFVLPSIMLTNYLEQRNLNRHSQASSS